MAKFIRPLRGGRKRASENISQAKVDVMPSHNINLCLGAGVVFMEWREQRYAGNGWP